MSRVKQQFGGDWTEDKLRRVRAYLDAYVTALKSQPFSLVYIDAFAGTGYVERQRGGDAALAPMFPDLTAPDSQKFLNGSARQALQVQPPFNEYVFIEKSKKRAAQLSSLRVEFPRLQDRIDIQNRDANEYLLDRCRKDDWRRRRAVLFLDPFGMSVDWTTIQAIAQTQAIDLWYLFPLGVGVNRLLKRDGDIPPHWRNALDRVFGETGWYEEFYAKPKPKNRGLFDDDNDNNSDEGESEKVADFTAISSYLVRRLKTEFAGVAKNPLPLCNSRNIPLFLLCFASANPKGAKIAVKIAQHILAG